jgi:hypothetical protein
MDHECQDISEYKILLGIMEDTRTPIEMRREAASRASRFIDRFQLAAAESPKVRYLRPHQEDQRIFHYGQIAKKAQAWLAQMETQSQEQTERTQSPANLQP